MGGQQQQATGCANTALHVKAVDAVDASVALAGQAVRVMGEAGVGDAGAAHQNVARPATDAEGCRAVLTCRTRALPDEKGRGTCLAFGEIIPEGLRLRQPGQVPRHTTLTAGPARKIVRSLQMQGRRRIMVLGPMSCFRALDLRQTLSLLWQTAVFPDSTKPKLWCGTGKEDFSPASIFTHGPQLASANFFRCHFHASGMTVAPHFHASGMTIVVLIAMLLPAAASLACSSWSVSVPASETSVIISAGQVTRAVVMHLSNPAYEKICFFFWRSASCLTSPRRPSTASPFRFAKIFHDHYFVGIRSICLSNSTF